MPYLCNCSACPEKIAEFLEKKDEQKKQKRRARPKKSAPAAVKEVDAQLQELLLEIESESGTLPCTTAGPQKGPKAGPSELSQAAFSNHWTTGADTDH